MLSESTKGELREYRRTIINNVIAGIVMYASMRAISDPTWIPTLKAKIEASFKPAFKQTTIIDIDIASNDLTREASDYLQRVSLRTNPNRRPPSGSNSVYPERDSNSSKSSSWDAYLESHKPEKGRDESSAGD